MSYSATKARAQFRSICRDSLLKKKKFYIKDPSGDLALTVAPSYKGDGVKVSLEEAKREFAAFARGCKFGIVFEIAVPELGSVFLRRHAHYKDPIDPYIAAWAESVITKKSHKLIMAEIKKTNDKLDELVTSSHEAHERTDRAIKRHALGYPPFEEDSAAIRQRRRSLS